MFGQSLRQFSWVLGNIEYESFSENVIGFVNVLGIADNTISEYHLYIAECNHLYFIDNLLICGGASG